MLSPQPTPIEALNWDLPAGVRFYVKRLDRVHPVISGNKFWKLYYNLQEAQRQQAAQLISFGGAFSNHIYALAAAGACVGIPTLGIIRGEELGSGTALRDNPSLGDAARFGMRFRFVSRARYRDKEAMVRALRREFPRAYLLPEGGTNALAVKGCRNVLDEETEGFDTILVPVGTGGTLSGISLQASPKQRIIGIPVLKRAYFLKRTVTHWTAGKDNWTLLFDYHRGGYAKVDEALVDFVNALKVTQQLPLDVVYNAKVFMAARDLAEKAYFRPGEKVLLLHTGGLQGNRGIQWRLRDRSYHLI